MQELKKSFYVSITSGEVLMEPAEPEGQFKIEATDDEVELLRDLLNENYDSDLEGFVESHVPFKQYHENKSNPHYDNSMRKIYSMLYELGDKKTRDHISSMGLLEDENNNSW
ncbi:hydrolase [Mesobacillus foraminis]|uniref:hydrolase n=1 Tax=Mesobacillus foraminis TaxID=279826 RepID=UPI0039A28DA0